MTPERSPGPSSGPWRALAPIVTLLVAAVGVGSAFWAFRGSGGSGSATPSPEPAVDRNGLIAFTSGRGGYHIAVVDPQTGEISDLTHPTGYDYDLGPRWSPTGDRVAFLRYTITDSYNVTGDYEIFIVKADGSNVTNLTPHMGEQPPSWSPDGSKLAFARTEKKGDGFVSCVCVIRADGTGEQSVADGMLAGRGGAWSPDGARLVIESGSEDRNTDIYAVSSDGSGLTRLTDSPEYDGQPVWSPDGRKIAFVSYRGGDQAIYVMNPDGSDQERVSERSVTEIVDPIWSPDGTRIAFAAHNGTDWDIYVVGADGAGQMAIAATTLDEVGPRWSPDGTLIAYSAAKVTKFDNTGSFDIYLVAPDGSHTQRLTEEAHELAGDLSWQAR